MTWMDHRKHQGLSVTYNNTKSKAIECYEHLKPKEMDPIPEFVASTGWFYNFKARHAFCSVKRSGEAKSADADATALYPDDLRAIIKEEEEEEEEEEWGGGGFTSPKAGLQHR